MHIERYYHHTGAEEHPGQNLIFVAPLPVFAPTTLHASPDASRIRNGHTGEVDGLRGKIKEEAAALSVCHRERGRGGGSVLAREEIGILYEKSGSSTSRSERDSGGESEETTLNQYLYCEARQF